VRAVSYCEISELIPDSKNTKKPKYGKLLPKKKLKNLRQIKSTKEKRTDKYRIGAELSESKEEGVEQEERVEGALSLGQIGEVYSREPLERIEEEESTVGRALLKREEWIGLLGEIPEDNCQYTEKSVSLGKRTHLKTAVFDLDNTLVCETSRGEFILRPYAKQILKEVSKYYEIIILTSSVRERAELIIKLLDPKDKIIKTALFRDSCVQITPNCFIKDLRIFKDRSLPDLILIDNDFVSFAYQPDNGYLIPSFNGADKDTHLLTLCQLLSQIKYAKDFRTELNN
jgi:hypothetical protein